MRSARQRFGFNRLECPHALDRREPRLSQISAGVRGPADVAFAGAYQCGLHRNPLLRQLAVCAQQVFLPDAASGELPGERLAGERGLGKGQHAGGFLVEPMNDGQVRPAGIPVPQPVVKAFPGPWARGMGVQASGFVYHQQVVVFEDQAGQHYTSGVNRLAVVTAVTSAWGNQQRAPRRAFTRRSRRPSKSPTGRSGNW